MCIRDSICHEDASGAITKALEGLGLPTEVPYSPEQIAKEAMFDKKRRGGNITLVLPEKIGKTVLYTVPVSQLEGIIKKALED